MSTLLPCPFCGGDKAALFINPANLDVSVVCDCGNRGRPIQVKIMAQIGLGEQLAGSDAIKAWNTRPSMPIEEMLAKIEKTVIVQCMKDVDADKREIYRAACYDVFKNLTRAIAQAIEGAE